MVQRGVGLAALVRCLVAAVVFLGAAPGARAQSTEKSTLDVYGFAMLDMGFDFKQNDPAWFDVMRPTKLPDAKDAFGKDGRFYSGVRQSRLGVKSSTPTELGVVKTIFEFELFGTGVDAGQTTFRLRHAWGEVGQFGAGQTWSPFMDPDVFPNSVEYWGPNGMVFFRNVQVRWMPFRGENALTLALERPGASADPAAPDALDDRLSQLQGRFPVPDLSAQFRATRSWGHVQLATIVREMRWDDPNADATTDLSGSALGWGVNVSTNLKLGNDVVRASVVYGAGIENYMNDAPVDLGIDGDPGSLKAKPIPVLGLVAFYDRTWSEQFSSTVGYSRVDISNTKQQDPNAFKTGQYALGNLMYYPLKGVMLGPEFQWARRENKSDGWSVDDYRIQFSAKFSFGHKFEF